jgi:hypothetical protein
MLRVSSQSDLIPSFQQLMLSMVYVGLPRRPHRHLLAAPVRFLSAASTVLKVSSSSRQQGREKVQPVKENFMGLLKMVATSLVLFLTKLLCLIGIHRGTNYVWYCHIFGLLQVQTAASNGRCMEQFNLCKTNWCLIWNTYGSLGCWIWVIKTTFFCIRFKEQSVDFISCIC